MKLCHLNLLISMIDDDDNSLLYTLHVYVFLQHKSIIHTIARSYHNLYSTENTSRTLEKLLLKIVIDHYPN